MESKTESKTILINPGDFQVKRGGGSTKKRSSNSNSSTELRVKDPVPRQRRPTVRNNNTLLRFIRRHQSEKRKDIFKDEPEYDEPHIHMEPLGETDKDDVEETLDYLIQLAKEVKHSNPNPQQPPPPPILHYPNHHGTLGNITTNENVSVEFPHSGTSVESKMPYPYNTLYSGGSATPQFAQSYSTQPTYNDVEEYEGGGGGGGTSTNIDNLEYGDDYDNKEKVKLKYVKQKKTRHRTFKVGKSKNIRTVGVLVSNRTIRKGITTRKQLMKQTPIHEIRQYLIKRGLIKVGTTAPNEVLRQMYESSQLICGELYNHNTDILLHNFMNDDATT